MRISTLSSNKPRLDAINYPLILDFNGFRQSSNNRLPITNPSLYMTPEQREIRRWIHFIDEYLDSSLALFPDPVVRFEPRQISSIRAAFLYLKYGYSPSDVAKVLDIHRTSVHARCKAFMQDCNYRHYRKIVSNIEAQLNMLDKGKGNLIAIPVTIKTSYDVYSTR